MRHGVRDSAPSPEAVLLTRRDFGLKSLSLALASAVPFGRAQAQTIARTARIAIGFPPGGSSDLAARLLAEHMKGYAPAIIVENKPGAGGAVVLEFAKSGPADGSLIVLSPMSMLVIYPLTDFIPVTTVCEFPFVISVGPLVPAAIKTLAEFIAWCRANPKLALYSTSGAGSTLHLTGVALARAAQFEFGHVPYNGAAAAQQDVLGGRIAANIGVLGSALPQIQSGQLRALATSGATRSPFLPDVPTFTEAGYSDVVAVEWQGLFVPAQTPAPVVDALYRSAREALQSSEVRAGLNKLSFEIRSATPAEFAALVKHDTERWSAIVKASGFVPED
jgi:tripartite-type tricarboxylate transporter receptor subunit TctC